MYIKMVIIILLTLIVNEDSDKDYFYNNIKYTSNTNSNLVLINKNNKLKENFIPSELVLLSKSYAHSNKMVKKEVKSNIENLINDSLKENLKITVVSAYRTYQYQNDLFNYYVKEKGLTYALKASAKPGHSEHQTGLAMDVEGNNNDYNKFIETEEFQWLSENCYKYGFILRYPLNKEHITGFKFEPWHYRYVGIEAATYIFKNNITLEEYLYK